MKNKQSVTIVVLVGVLFIVIALSSYYSWAKNRVQPIEQVPDTIVPTVNTTDNLKEINLFNKYSLKTPEDFSFSKIPATTSSLSSYEFIRSSDQKNFFVSVSPYLVSNALQNDGKCAVSSNLKKAYCEGKILESSFEISGGRKVFYAINPVDLDMTCIGDSKCKIPPEAKYSLTYIFIIADKTQNILVEFFAPDAVRNGNDDTQIFEGIGKILYETIIPSFSLIGSANQTVSCEKNPEALPFISSISNTSIKVGETLEINGCNLAGFEGDNYVWIENSDREAGILYGSRRNDNAKMEVVIKPSVCRQDNSYKDDACDDKKLWFDLIPGEYKIYTMPWGKKSNVVSVTIK